MTPVSRKTAPPVRPMVQAVPEARDCCWRSTPACSHALPLPRQWERDSNSRAMAAIPAATPVARPSPPPTRNKVDASRGPSTVPSFEGGGRTTTGMNVATGATGGMGAIGGGVTGTPGGT